MKMYEILSSSGKSKVEQCARFREIKSDLKMKSSLTRGHSAGRYSSASACRGHMKLRQYFLKTNSWTNFYFKTIFIT